MSTTPDLTGRPSQPRELDTDRLGEITDRDGFAVFDPAAPGGVRELTATEHQHLAQVGPTDHEAYLGSRPTGGEFDPTLDYGHPRWREPESDAEAEARTAHLDTERASHPPAAPELREPTELEGALDTAGQDASLADRAHDHDPALWERYEQLLALDDLRPLPEHQPQHHSEQDEIGQGETEQGEIEPGDDGLRVELDEIDQQDIDEDEIDQDEIDEEEL